MNVSLYRCFKADQRISMEVYADGLVKALEHKGVKPLEIVPKSNLERFNDNVWCMRYLRYRYYPSYVRKSTRKDTQIHHVIDHAYAHLQPNLGSGKKVLSVHDLIPFLTWRGVIKKHGKDSSISERKPLLNLYSLKFIQHFDHVVCASQSTANDLQTYLGIVPELITVIPPVIEQKFFPSSEDRIRKLRTKYQLDEQSKWLMISGKEYYKNHRTSLLVLKKLINSSDQTIKLIKTGMPSVEFDELVTELGLSDYVKAIYLTDSGELPVLYSLVDCLLFPSTYEGFGMPVAEALACGTPVVMSDRASLPEVGGKLALQCDAYDVEALSKAVYSQLNSESKSNIIKHGPLWLTQFRENSIGEKMTNLYTSLM